MELLTKHLTLSWQRPISYRNQSIDLRSKSMDWFLYDIGLRHERVKKIIYDKMHFSLLPFRVWNHVFHCCRFHYERNMCLFCTKLYLRNKKICKLIENINYWCFGLFFCWVDLWCYISWIHKFVSPFFCLTGKNCTIKISVQFFTRL